MAIENKKEKDKIVGFVIPLTNESNKSVRITNGDDQVTKCALRILTDASELAELLSGEEYGLAVGIVQLVKEILKSR